MYCSALVWLGNKFIMIEIDYAQATKGYCCLHYFCFSSSTASPDIDIISIVATNDLVQFLMQPSYLGKRPPVVENESHCNRQRNSKNESLIMYICHLLPVSLVPYRRCYMIDTTQCNEGNNNQHQCCNSCIARLDGKKNDHKHHRCKIVKSALSLIGCTSWPSLRPGANVRR